MVFRREISCFVPHNLPLASCEVTWICVYKIFHCTIEVISSILFYKENWFFAFLCCCETVMNRQVITACDYSFEVSLLDEVIFSGL